MTTLLQHAAAVLGADGPALVRGTAHLAVAAWAVASAWMLWQREDGWLPGNWRLRLTRVLWLLGWLAALLHAATAFEFAHGWSHAAAVEHTARVGGVGEGVFANYLFVAAWGADAAWLLIWPGGYVRRPRWVGAAVHGYLGFITFNAAVVFAAGIGRWVGIGWFALLASVWVWRLAPKARR